MDLVFPAAGRFFRANRWLIVILAAISLLSYGYELFNFNISVDAELIGVDKDQWYWISIGRWGMYLINSTLMLYTTIPLAPLAIALICILLSCIAIFRLFAPDRLDHWGFVFPALALSFPTLPHLLMFSTSAAGIGLAMLSASVGMYFYTSTSAFRKAASIVFFAFSVGVYQSFFFFVAGVMIMMSLFQFIEDSGKDRDISSAIILKQFSMHGLFLLMTFILYIVLSYSFMMARGLEPRYGRLIQPELLFVDTLNVLTHSLEYVYAAYLGDGKVYTISLPLILVANAVSLFSILMFAPTFRNTIAKLLVVLTCLLIPFAFNVLGGGFMPLRSLLALPFISTLLWWMGYRYGGVAIKRVMVILGAVLLIQFSIINNRNFNANGIALDQDKVTASNLIFDIDRVLAERVVSRPFPCVEFAGKKNLSENEFFVKHEVFGASFYGWASDAPEHVWRIYRFLKLMGLNTNLRVCSAEKSRGASDVVRRMPSWPRDDSIAIIGDVLVVKLSDTGT